MFRTSFGQLRPNVRTFDGDNGAGGGSSEEEQKPAEGTKPTEGEQKPADQQQQAKERVEDLPDWAQKIIRDTRAEAASHRTKANSAATDAEKALTDRLATALGLKPDAKTDPAELTKQLTAAQQSQRDTAIQLAVYRAAGTHKGNPDALLDSRAFLASVQSLDPTSSDFTTQVSDAVKSAVGSTPSLRLVQATGASTTDHAPGGETGAITEQQLASMTDEQIAKAFDEGRLNHLL